MTLQLSNLQEPTLTGEAVAAATVLTARLRGTADVETRPGLESYVEALHKEACRVAVTNVVVDSGRQ